MRAFAGSIHYLHLVGALVALSFGCASPDAPHDSAPRTDAAARELFEASRWPGALERMSALMLRRVEARLGAADVGLPPAELQVLFTAVESALAPVSLRAGMLDALRVDAASAAIASTWWRSDLGRRLIAAEREQASGSGDLRREQKQFLSAMRLDPLPLARISAIERYEAADHLTEREVRVQQGQQLTSVLALNATRPPSQRLDSVRLRQAAEQQWGALVTDSHRRLLPTVAFMLRDFSDAELEQLIAFFESEAGRTTEASLDAAFAAALVRAFGGLESEVPAALDRVRSEHAS